MKKRHGVSIGVERVGAEIFIGLKVVGKLSHEDYEVFTPILDSALSAVDDPNVKMLVDLRDFDGWELRAAWDDLRLGLKHGRQFKRIALYGDFRWQDAMTKIASWFMSGEIKSFETVDEAMEWLNLED